MDDLGSKINEILSDPKALEQIQELSKMFSLPDSPQNPIHKNEEKGESNSDMSLMGTLSSPQTLSLISKISPLLADVGQEDDTTRLLKSLRPFLSDNRKQKLDEASKLLKMMRLFSQIKDMNLLDSIF